MENYKENQNDLEKFNRLAQFLNDLIGKLNAEMERDNRKNFKLLTKELYEIADDIKERLNKEVKVSNFPEFPKFPKFPEFPEFPDKIKIDEVKVSNFPKFPEFPRKLSFEEADDIITILKNVLEELKNKKISFETDDLEKSLHSLELLVADEMELLRKSLPKAKDFLKLPKELLKFLKGLSENGRWKVVLPNSQIVKTPLGERLNKNIKGIFLGGSSKNPISRISDKNGNVINPATEATLANIQSNTNPALTPTIYNVSMASKDTEYSQLLPNGTKILDAKLRAASALLKIAWTSGESGTNYIQIPYGSSYHLENVNLTNITIYFQSPTAAQTCEIVCWV